MEQQIVFCCSLFKKYGYSFCYSVDWNIGIEYLIYKHVLGSNFKFLLNNEQLPIHYQ